MYTCKPKPNQTKPTHLTTVSKKCRRPSFESPTPTAVHGPSKCRATNSSSSSSLRCDTRSAAATCAISRLRRAAFCIISDTPE